MEQSAGKMFHTNTIFTCVFSLKATVKVSMPSRDERPVKFQLVQFLLIGNGRRVRKNWRDIYFFIFTRPGHIFLYLSVAFPAIRNWLTRYQMKDMDITFHMTPSKFM